LKETFGKFLYFDTDHQCAKFQDTGCLAHWTFPEVVFKCSFVPIF